MKVDKFISIIFFITSFLFSFGQIGRVSIPGKPIYFYIFEPFIVLLNLLLFIKFKDKIFKLKIFKVSILFISYLFVTLIFSLFRYEPTQNLIAFLYLSRLSVYIFFIPLIFLYFKSFAKKPSKLLLFSVFISLSIIFLSTITQYFLYPNLGNIAYLGWDPHINRAVGVFFDPPITVSIFFLIIIFFATTFDFKNKIYFLPVLLSIPIIFLTYSRGGYFSIIFTTFFAFFMKKKFKFILIFILIMIVGFLLLPKENIESIDLTRTASIKSRIVDYKQGFEIFKKNPILGIGYNNIRAEKSKFVDEVFLEPYNPSHAISSFHSSFLIIIVTGGIFGLIFFLTYLFELSNFSDFLKYSIFYLSVISIFDNVLLHPLILVFLGLLASCNINLLFSRKKQ